MAALAACGSAPPTERGHTARAEFRRTHACPATGLTRGPCPGWVIDHLHPLCAGGADHPRNMQWQTRAEALAKDRVELRYCRRLHRTI